MTQPLSRIVLALAGVMAVFIGGALLVSPHAFFAMNHIDLGDDPNLLSEIRAPGGLLLAAGAIMIAGVAMRRLTRIGLVTAAVVYCSYGASRLLGILLDGAPIVRRRHLFSLTGLAFLYLGKGMKMTKYILLVLAILGAMAAWALLVFFAANEGWGRRALTPSQSPDAFVDAANLIVETEHVGNFGLVLVEGGDVAASLFRSTGAPVSERSVFQVASLSKWITAWGVMALVEDGLINLDTPVSEYLSRWRLPASDFDNSGVTVRRLLSHTSGLDDGLGYDGFDTAAEVQSLENSLTKARDASPGNSGVVKVGTEPGTEWNYSGGGYTLLQLVVEEVSKQSFATFMTERVFKPLGMNSTTFAYEEAVAIGLAENFDLKGDTEPFKFYTSLAATSLFTTVADMTTFIQAQSVDGSQTVLSDETLELIRTPHASQMGADIWGLGAMLYAPNNMGGFVIGHDGNNEPAINTAVRLDPETGDGIVILETGSSLLATKLASEWVFWKTGNIDSLLFLIEFRKTLLWIGVGALMILIAGVVFIWRVRTTTAKRANAASF